MQKCVKCGKKTAFLIWDEDKDTKIGVWTCEKCSQVQLKVSIFLK